MLSTFNRHAVLAISLTCLSSEAVAATCETDVAACTIVELCSTATITKRGYLEWDFDSLDHVSYAKNNGLNCGVDSLTKSSDDQAEAEVKFTKNDFATYNRLERLQIQYALKSLGYYSSGVDGLWGKGTKRGLNKFIQDEGITENLATNVYRSLTLEVDVSNVTLSKPSKSTSGAYKSVASATVTSASDQNRKICRLNENVNFENMLQLNSDLTRKTKKEFNGLREIEMADGKLLNRSRAIKPNADGLFKLYIAVLCEKNANNWSRCGTFQANAALRMRGNNVLQGKLFIPWEWAARSPQMYSLEYTCSNS